MTVQPEVSSNTRKLVLSLVAVLSILGLGGTAVLPYLAVEQPLLLVALAPNIRNIVLVAPQADAVTLVTIGVLRRVLALSATYGLGYIYGPMLIRKTVESLPKVAWFVRFFERLFRRVGAPVLLVLPTYTLAGLAGAARTRWSPFVVAITIGQTVWVTASVHFGEVMAQWTQPIIDFFSRYMLPATAVCIGLVLLQQAIARRRNKPADIA